jgi:hypothetical protein
VRHLRKGIAGRRSILDLLHYEKEFSLGGVEGKVCSLAPRLYFGLKRLLLESKDVRVAAEGTRPSNWRGHFWAEMEAARGGRYR